MDRKEVKSSQIASVGYDPEKQICEIEFRGGAVYEYFDVSPETHKALMEAESAGRYFNQRFRGFFKFSKVAPEEAANAQSKAEAGS